VTVATLEAVRVDGWAMGERCDLSPTVSRPAPLGVGSLGRVGDLLLLYVRIPIVEQW
jgi:hypothetical protein